MAEIFFEISIVVVVGTICAAIAKYLRQPTIPAYILAGVLLGPSVFNLVESGELLHTLSTFGIAFLLFLVGIELDVRKFLKTGRIAVILGMAQMAFSIGVGYVIIRFLGYTSSAAFFLAIALGFASTIIVLKLLGERRELDTLHGRLLIGLMLTQDFAAILFLMFFNVWVNFSAASNVFGDILLTIIKGMVLFGLTWFAAKYLLARLFHFFANARELLFLAAISWCLIFAMLAMALNFSVEIGALLAGVSLSFVPYHIEIANRVKSLRDFFLPIFFAVLGAQLIFTSGESVILPTIILSIFVLAGAPFLVTVLLMLLGYHSRVSFQTGSAIGQVSEFSFILVSLAYNTGILEQSIVSLVALIGLITMTASTYVIKYQKQLYFILAPVLKKIERKSRARALQNIPENLRDHVVLIGYHTMGYKIYQIFKKRKIPVLAIDHNPDAITQLNQAGIPHLYGSMADEEVLRLARLDKATLIISTSPSYTGTMALLDFKKDQKIRAKTIMTAYRVDHAMAFYAEGASLVLYPDSISADYLEHIIDQDFQKQRQNHIAELRALHILDQS